MNVEEYKPDENGHLKRCPSFALIPVSQAMNDIAPIEWLINNYLPHDGIAEIFGASGHLKTFSAMGIACSVASGTAWCGEPVKHGGVIYIAGEGNNYLMRRTKAWCIENNVDPKNLKMVVSTRSMGLTDSESVAEVISKIRVYVDATGEIPMLVVIDTLARNFGSGDENSTQDMNLMIRHSEDIMAEFPSVTLLFIHHTGHSTAERSRGSSALYAALDAQFKCSVTNNALRFECKKMKEAEEPKPVIFAKKVVEIGIKEHDGSEATSLVLTPTGEAAKDVIKLSPTQKILMSLFHEAFSSLGKSPPASLVADKSVSLKAGQLALSLSEFRTFVFVRGGISSSDKEATRTRTYQRAVLDLRNKAVIDVNEDWVWLATKATRCDK